MNKSLLVSHSAGSFSLPLMDIAGAFPMVVPISYVLAAGLNLFTAEINGENVVRDNEGITFGISR